MGARPPKRIGVLRGLGLPVLAVLFLFASAAAFPALPLPDPRDEPSASPSRATAVIEDRLYLRANGTQGTPVLSTTAGTNGQTRALPTEFALETPLGRSAEIVGLDVPNGGKGMWLWFQVTGSPVLNSINITVFQNNDTVASGSTTVTGVSGVRRWDVPFTSGQAHTFPAGSTIRVRIAASLPLTTITYNNAEAYIYMPLTELPIFLDAGTSYAQGKPTTEFHPNWPDEVRRMRVEGTISSLFGPSDIAGVNVTIKSPSGDVASTGTGQLTGVQYLFFWNYSKGQVPGNYNITVTVTDRQGHPFEASTVVTMLRYAVYLTSPQMDADGIVKGVASPPRGGAEQKDAVYTLEVVNTGYSASGMSVRISSVPPTGWDARLSTTNLATIQPGEKTSITFTVSPSDEVEYGSKAVIYVDAVADASTSVPKSSWQITTVTNATMSRNFEFSILGQSEAWVDAGQRTSYQMLVQNRGVLDMNITFSVFGTPAGWSHSLDVSGKVYLDTAANSQRVLTLIVTAPPEEMADLSKVAQISVNAQVVEDTSLEKSVTTVTRLITILGLSVNPLVITSDPGDKGGRVDFTVTINNMDPMNSHQVKLTITPPGDWLSSTVVYSPKESLLNPNGTTSITVSVTPPSTAEADEEVGYHLTVKVEPNDKPQRSNTTVVVVKVRQRYEIALEASLRSIEVTPGQKKALTLTVKNLGNGNDSIILYVATGVPQGWMIYLDTTLSPPNPLTIPLKASGRAGDIVTVNLTVEPASSSTNGQKVEIMIKASSPKALEKSISVKATVKTGPWEQLRAAINDSLMIIILCGIVLLTFGVVWRRTVRPA